MQEPFTTDDDTVVRRLVRVTIERGAFDAWTAHRLAARLGLPLLPVRRALDHLAARGLVVLEHGEYRAVDQR